MLAKQNPKHMGEIHETMKGTTCEKWYTDNGISYDAFRMAFRSLGLKNFGKKRVLTVAELSQIENYPFRKQKDKPKPKENKTPRTYTVEPSAPEKPKVETGRAKFEWPTASKVRAVAFNIIAVGVVVGHGALIWYECNKLWGGVGFFGGLVVFMVVLLAVLLASDPSKNRTSSYALWFMACVDTAAYWVHYPSFVNYSIDDAVRMGVCIFICACSFIALLLFRDYKLD